MVLFSSQQMPEGAEILHEEDGLQAEDFYKLLTFLFHLIDHVV